VAMLIKIRNMLKIKILYLFTLALFLSSCSKDKFNGDWIYSDKLVLSFLDKNEFKWTTNNSKVDWYGKYFIQPDQDSLILNTQWDFSIRFKYQFVNNSLVLWNQKANSGDLKGHIDEILTFIKKGQDKQQVRAVSKKEIFMLPPNFIGFVYINYNQKGSGNNLIDDQNNRKIEVTNDGLVKTEFEESILPLAFGLYEFKSPLRTYSFFIQDLIKDSEMKSLKTDSIYVCVYGYNQERREEITKLFGQKINGNVLMFRVDTLKNIMKTIKKY
jgi:hypothetical protein